MVVLMKRPERKEQVHRNQDSASKVGLLIYKSATGLPGTGISPKPLWMQQPAGAGIALNLSGLQLLHQ